MARPTLSRAVFSGLTFGARALERASRLFYHAASGAVPRDTLERVITKEWDLFRTSFPVEAGLHPWEKTFFARTIRPGDRIFIVGCGSGRDLLPLLDQGHEIDGNDLVASCVAEAEQHVAARGKRARLFSLPIESCPLDGKYDVILFSWFTYQYIPGSQNRVDILRRLASHLAPSGRILLSHGRPLSAPRRATHRLTRAVAVLVGNDWRPEFGDVLTAGGGRYFHYEHYFFPGEEEREALAAGLKVTYHDTVSHDTVVWMLEPDAQTKEEHAE